MDYCKITDTNEALMMPNPYRLEVVNPTDEQKATIAEFDNWLEMVYTEEPPHTETQYTTFHWEEIDGKAVQVWVIHDIEAEVEE